MAALMQDVVRNIHHEQLPFCETRPAYRQGRKLTAVKVFTISDESKHLLIVGVPAITLHDQVKQLCSRYGDVLSVVLVPSYTEDEFSDAFHVHYSKLQCSRFAKRQLDGKEFYGGILHVCYIPEMESIAETRQKLIQRRREVAVRCCREIGEEKVKRQCIRQYQRKTFRAGIEGEKRFLDPVSAKCIWNGGPLREDPRCGFTPSNVKKVYGPQLPSADWKAAGVLGSYFVPNLCKDSSASQKRHFSGPAQVASEAPSLSANSPVLRFIPRQIKGIQRTTIPAKNNFGEEPPNTSDKSLDTTVQAIRNRIREVSVPNIKVHLSGRKENRKES